ncbi:MAG TPA: alcohol dehydrogenase catalytic domain-containing protein [Bryobacteraceae bacterium]|nr:alcohol dehydrogenase catalytic domain-containing protein [Bryobacteraceae bacterium]
MRSVPLVQPRRLELIEAPMPEGPRQGELLVKLAAVGLCGSDVHWWADGHIHGNPARYPQVLGHEPVATIVETGPGVHGFKAGDLVSIEPSLTCGHCEFCIQGRHNLCVSSRFMGGPSADGFLRDYAIIPVHNADPVPEGLSFHQATLVEPLAFWVHIYELAPVRMQQTIAVMGCGPIGLLGIAMAKAAGAETILACDRVPHRLAIARRMGATAALDLRTEDFRDAVMQATRGLGAHQIYDAAGSPETINLGIRCARPGGRVTFIGIPTPLNFEVDLHTAMAKELDLQVIKRSNHKGRQAAALLASGQIPTTLITHALPLEQAQNAFEMLHEYAGGAGKVLLDLTL